MNYDSARHTLNNPTRGGVFPSDEHFFGARPLIPLTNMEEMPSAAGTVVVPGGFGGTVPEIQSLIDSVLNEISTGRTAQNKLRGLLRNNF